MTLPAHPFGTDITPDDIIAQMQAANGWEDRYRTVIQLGKKLPALPEALKQDQLKVSGCESQVWLAYQVEGEIFHFAADSDARIVRACSHWCWRLMREKQLEKSMNLISIATLTAWDSLPTSARHAAMA